MSATKNTRSVRRIVLVAAQAGALCLAVAYGAYTAAKPASSPDAIESPVLHSLADFEQAFWACDYIATVRGVAAAPVELCSAVTASLQEEKFAGDLGRMLEWWQQNKRAQHGRLEASGVLANR